MRSLIFLLSLLIISSILYSETIHVAGDVFGTWSADSVKVDGEITIPNGETLTINPGTYVEFQGHYKLNVQGRLLAVGAEGDSITFTIYDTTGFGDWSTGTGGWHGIRFIDTPETNDSSRIEYCILEYGKAVGDSHDRMGGGIYLYGYSKLIITHSRISNNYGDFTGGICCNVSSTPKILYNFITYNISENEGGGIGTYFTSPIIAFNLITHNYVTSSYGRGGGIFCQEQQTFPKILNNNLENNYANEGGAIFIDHSSPTISNNTIKDNIARSGGGGIYCEVASPEIEGNIVIGNTISEEWGEGGGIKIDNFSQLELIDNLISNNKGGEKGGGIFFGSYSSSIMIGNTITNNESGLSGGGIYCGYSNFHLLNCTVVNNKAGEFGGGISFYGNVSLLFINSIFYNNSANNHDHNVYIGSSDSESEFYYNNIQSDLEGFSGPGADNFPEGNYQFNIDAEPLFVNPSPIVGIDTISTVLDWSLMDESPCINAGTPDNWNIPETELVINELLGYNPIGGYYDIGAYETDILPPTSIHVIGDVSGVWDADTVFVDGEITIPDGETLTINPGTYVEFQGHYALQVKGRLLAVGAEGDSITFTINDTTEFGNWDTGAGGWHGIRFIFTSETNDSSRIEHCILEYGKAVGEDTHERVGGAICLYSFSKMKLVFSSLRNNYATNMGGGIFCSSSSPYIINNSLFNTITNTWGGTIGLVNSSALIIGNLIKNNIALRDIGSGGGIFCSESSPLIKENSIIDNTAQGDFMAGGGGIMCYLNSSPIIEGNSILGNYTHGAGGGGIMCYLNSSPIIEGNSILGNYTHGAGGGICALEGSIPVVDNNIIIDNFTDGDMGGGGIFIEADVSIQMTGNTISSNYAQEGFGGGLYHRGSTNISIQDNTILNNTSDKSGGGIYIDNSNNADIINCLITANEAGEQGGGIYCDANSLSISSSSIMNNTAILDGGGIFVDGSSIFVNNKISGNSSEASGGGLYAFGNSYIQHNNIRNNDAAMHGAGIYLKCSDFNRTISNNTITNNTTGYYGGGICINYSLSRIFNNTICNNVAQNGYAVYIKNNSDPYVINNIMYNTNSQYEVSTVFIFDEDSRPHFSYNDIENNLEGFAGPGSEDFPEENYQNNIDADPLFVNPSTIIGIDTISTDLDWSLLDDSPCINTGTPDGWIVPELNIIINELLGFEPIDIAYDIGAFESDVVGINPYVQIGRIEQLSASNHPNPFNPTTTISYSLPSSDNVKLSIYNIKGQFIERLVNENQSAGNHSVVWNGANSKGESVGSGVYFYRLETGEETIARKMLLVK